MIIEKKIITLRGLLRDAQVEALVYGDWAAHRQLAAPDMFCITLLPIGLSLPLAWASFRKGLRAVDAVIEISRMRNSWSRVTQQDFTKQLEDQLRAICLKHGATEGAVQFSQDCDKNSFGLPTKERVNGYNHPGI